MYTQVEENDAVAGGAQHLDEVVDLHVIVDHHQVLHVIVHHVVDHHDEVLHVIVNHHQVLHVIGHDEVYLVIT